MIKNKTVYLTFDVDGLDSSIMPATGTPEPGGLLWDETLNIIKIAEPANSLEIFWLFYHFYFIPGRVM